MAKNVWLKHEAYDTQVKSIRYFPIKNKTNAVLFSLCLATVCTLSVTNFVNCKKMLVNCLRSQFIYIIDYTHSTVVEIFNQVKYHDS